MPTKSRTNDEYVRINNEVYQLCGVLDHLGVDHSAGHWITWTRNNQAEKGWMLCDDSFIQSTSLQNVMNKNNYVLAYQKYYEETLPPNGASSDYLSAEIDSILTMYQSSSKMF